VVLRLSVDRSVNKSRATPPVLVDVVSGGIKPIQEKPAHSLEALPLKDSVMAITDESYFDWPVRPEAPSSLNIALSGKSPKLTWSIHGGAAKRLLGGSAVRGPPWGR